MSDDVIEGEVVVLPDPNEGLSVNNGVAWKKPPGQHAFQKGNPWAWQKGQNPQHRKGVRDKLSTNFLVALSADFEKRGHLAIENMRRKKPADYVKVVASLLPKQIEIKDEPFDGIGDAELVAILAYARDALSVRHGGRARVPAPDGHEQTEGLPPLPEAG